MMMVWLRIFLSIWWCESEMCSVETILPILIFPRLAIYNMILILSCNVTQWTAASQASLSITNSWSLPKLMTIELVMPPNHLIFCHALLLPSIFPNMRVFSNESLHIRWPKYWSFSFNISPSNEHPGLISFRMDWLDLLAIQGTLKMTVTSIKISQVRLSLFLVTPIVCGLIAISIK